VLQSRVGEATAQQFVSEEDGLLGLSLNKVAVMPHSR
jgi:hypothetical protein